MQAYLAIQRGWLRVERRPGYGPDLNPVEMLLGNIKGQELANRCAQELDEAVAALGSGMDRVPRRRKYIFFSATRWSLFLTNLSVYYASFNTGTCDTGLTLQFFAEYKAEVQHGRKNAGQGTDHQTQQKPRPNYRGWVESFYFPSASCDRTIRDTHNYKQCSRHQGEALVAR
jgi:hypothetical protein